MRCRTVMSVLSALCAAWACGDPQTPAGSDDDDDDDAAAVDAAPVAGADAAALDAPAPEPTAFRVDRFELRDPHIFIDFIGCADITETIAGGDGLNDILQDQITTDGDGDGLLDLSMMLVFVPLEQGGGGVIESGTADCTAPLSSTTCHSVAPLDRGTYSSAGSGACLAPFAGTTSSAGYRPGVSVPSSPCFATQPLDLEFDFGSVIATLAGNQNSATYVGDPAGTLANGNFRAFLAEADAAAILLPIEGVGEIPLIDLLPGSPTNCASHDDRDLGPDGATRGWWFYFDFSASRVPYVAAATGR